MISDCHKEQFEELMECLIKSGIKLIYVYPLDRISKTTLFIYKVPLIATNITFVKNNIFSLKSINNIKPYDSDDQYEESEKLALLSGQYSRFRRDRNFK